MRSTDILQYASILMLIAVVAPAEAPEEVVVAIPAMLIVNVLIPMLRTKVSESVGYWLYEKIQNFSLRSSKTSRDSPIHVSTPTKLVPKSGSPLS